MTSPRLPVRRFDVFAEYNRQKAISEGTPPDEAAGYGLWLAKVVASRGIGRAAQVKPPGQGKEVSGDEEEEQKSKWHELSGKPQTDELFRREIIERMGTEFYAQVFVPAIEDAFKAGKSYTAIRDTIRREWKP